MKNNSVNSCGTSRCRTIITANAHIQMCFVQGESFPWTLPFCGVKMQTKWEWSAKIIERVQSSQHSSPSCSFLSSIPVERWTDWRAWVAYRGWSTIWLQRKRGSIFWSDHPSLAWVLPSFFLSRCPFLPSPNHRFHHLGFPSALSQVTITTTTSGTQSIRKQSAWRVQIGVS